MKIVQDEDQENKKVELTEDQKLQAKAEQLVTKYGLKSTKKIFYISVLDEDAEGDEEVWLGGWLKKPSLSDFSMFTTMAESDKINALKTILKTVWIEGEGDKRILEEDDLLMAAMLQVEPIMNVFASKIKKF